MHQFLKKATVMAAFTLFLFTSLSAQSTERFVRIIGNASQVYESDKTRVYFTVSEVAPNEYKQIPYKTLESSYADFVEELGALGVAENEITQSNAEIGRYNKTKTRNYFVDIADQETMDGLSGSENPGFKVKKVVYLFTDVDEDIESTLSLQAIQDAKRKASKICAELGMKLGKILNIEDRSSGCCSDIPESREPRTTKKYKVTITFELLDK